MGERVGAAGCGWLVAPFVALLWPAFYSSLEPTLGGIPFFFLVPVPLDPDCGHPDRICLFHGRLATWL